MFDIESYNAIVSVANRYNIEPAKLLAVTQVESNGTPYWNIGGKRLPVIRFEGHYFYRFLSGDQRTRAVQAGLASSKAGAVKNPGDATARYKLLDRARKINRDAANMSVSWGVGQVMGSNWSDLGYASVDDLVNSATKSIDGQVELMVRFIIKNNLLDELQAKKWAAFARGYNGPSYKTNKYDTKLAAAYAQFAKAKTPAQAFANDTAALQKKLALVGAYDGKVDGNFGPVTTSAVQSFQADNGLEADGDVGSITSDAIDKAVNDVNDKKHDQMVKTVGVIAGSTLPVAGGVIQKVSDNAAPLVDTVNKVNDNTSAISNLFSTIGVSGIAVTVILAIVAAATLYFILRKK